MRVNDYTTTPMTDATELFGTQSDSGNQHNYTAAQIATYLKSTAAGVVADANLLAQTGTVSPVVLYAGATTTSTYQVGIYLNVASIGGATIQVSVGFTDENSNSHGILVLTVTTSGIPLCSVFTIRAKNATTIAVIANVSGGTPSYDISATITKMN